MNNIELYLIKALLKKDTFNIYREYLDEVFSDKKSPINKIFSSLDKLMSETDSDKDVQSFSIKFFSDYPFLKREDVEYFSTIFSKIEAIDAELPFSELLQKFQEKSIATSIAKLALDVAEGRDKKDELFSLFQSFFSEENKEIDVDASSPFVREELNELLDSQIYSGGLHWRLKCLRESLGPLRKGDFGFLFARPETGKTTFLASEVTNFLEQAENPILWFNNEERGEKVFLRCYQAAFGVTHEELRNNKHKYQEEWKNKYSGKLLLYDSAAIGKHDILKLVETYSPSLIVVDQIDKIKGFTDDRNDLALGQIYIWARELAKEFCPVIGVCQAGASGEGKQWLTMDDVVNAKTSKQAEADWILGIGCSQEGGNVRYLNISKNKLIGGPETLSEYRHGRFQVIIRPELARYEDI